MKIETLVLNDTNCYLISTEKSALVIDPGFKSDVPIDFFSDNKNKERLILLTHAHFDHIGDAKRLRDISGVQIAIGENDNIALSDNIINEGANFGIYIEPFSADILLKNGQSFTVGDIEIKVFELKGHTVGGACYLINNHLFTGDILFYRAFGNTCFNGGSRREMLNSLNFLFNAFPPETEVYPGHGISTTIGSEKNYYGR